MKKEIKNIIFDFGGVLVNLDKPLCIEAFANLGFTQAASLVDAYSQQGIFKELELGTITPEAFCNEVRQMTGISIKDNDLWRAWNMLITGIPTYKLEALLELRKHYRVFLLSNTNIIHWEYACQNYFRHNGYEVKDYFERIFLSFEMHLVKPEQEIFKLLLEETGIKPEETLFIDDAVANCQTANELGISTYCPTPEEDWRKALSII